MRAPWRVAIRSVALLVALASASLGSFGMDAASAQETFRADIVYRPIVDEAVVRVETSFYVDTHEGGLPWLIPVEATNIESDVSVDLEPLDEFWNLALVFTGESTSELATVSYDLPSDPPRSQGDTRVNRAHISFLVAVDPFMTDGSVRVVTPDGFGARVDRSLMEPVVENGELVWLADPIPDPESFFFRFVASNEEGLTRTELSVENEQITIASWSDDPEWRDFASEQVTSGVPLLAEMIGQPWPAAGLVVAESAAPALEGYAGWYDIRENEIEVGDQLDQRTMLHELSHAWFSPTTFAERWIYEGFAEEFSSQAAVTLGGSADEPPRPDAPPSGFDGLSTWGRLGFFGNIWEIEFYGYETSYYVMRQLTEEIGVEGLADVIGSMFDRELSYAAPGDPPSFQPNDWRRFLDLLEREAGSEAAAGLFETYVIPASERGSLELRTETIASYESFRARTTDLGMPRFIRESMSTWKFQRVEGQIDAADELVSRMDLAAARADQLDMSLPPFLAERYREADGSFGPVSDAIDETNRVLDTMSSRGTGSPSFDADQRNFEIGRFELIDTSGPELGRLNDNASTGAGYGIYLVAIGVLVVALIGVGTAATVIGSRPTPASPPPKPMPLAPTLPHQTSTLPPPPPAVGMRPAPMPAPGAIADPD